MAPPLRHYRRALPSPSQWNLLLQRRDLSSLLAREGGALSAVAPAHQSLGASEKPPGCGPHTVLEHSSLLQTWRAVAPHAPHLPATSTRVASPASLAAQQHALFSLSARGMTTHVGHGSGGRAGGPGLHEPPETHPFAVKGLNHIALAVPNVADAAEHYRTVFGAQVSDAHDLPEHGVKVVFVHIGLTHIELLEPLGEKSPIAKFLEKHPRGGLHHLCFTVDNIEVASRHVSEEGVRILGEHTAAPSIPDEGAERKHFPEPKIGAHGAPVIFLDPRDNLGVLCELEQVTCNSPNDAHHC